MRSNLKSLMSNRTCYRCLKKWLVWKHSVIFILNFLLWSWYSKIEKRKVTCVILFWFTGLLTFMLTCLLLTKMQGTQFLSENWITRLKTQSWGCQGVFITLKLFTMRMPTSLPKLLFFLPKTMQQLNSLQCNPHSLVIITEACQYWAFTNSKQNIHQIHLQVFTTEEL